MSKVQMLRALVEQRLTAAAEDIFVLFERTIAEYERENERQRKLLDAVFSPQIRLHRTDVQQLLMRTEECPPEQRSPSPDQEHPEPPHIKEEEEELWSSQEGEQLQGLEEAEISRSTFSPVPVKTEDDEDKPQSSQLHQSHTEETCGGPGPGPAMSSDPDTDVKTSEPLTSADPSLSDVGSDTDEKPFRCSQCGRRFRQRRLLQIHMRIHTGEKPFSCSVCSKKFPHKKALVRHMRIHTGEKPFSCSFCQKHFTRSDHVVRHMRIHTRETLQLFPVWKKLHS